ncbi:MAG: YbhB/YbcL family Raf kinase inhibitor-like protein [Polyangiales bacterium]
MRLGWLAFLLCPLLVLSCKKEEEPSKPAAPAPDTGASSLAIETPEFFPGQPIPKKYTCDGEDLSPEVKWSKAPPVTKSFLLIVDDPDAPTGTFTHWVIFDMPIPSTHVPEAAKGIGTQALNDFGKAKWNGPCPPPGKEHRYFFRLYALDLEDLGLADGVNRYEVEKRIDGHVVGKVETMGTYKR